jgi:protein ImuA
VQEIYADQRRDAGTAFGFALGQARTLLTARRPAFIVLSLAHEAQDIGLPYGAGIAHFGLAPEAMVIGRVETLTELFWALEEAIACRAVAAVIADVAGTPKTLDFTVSRRLSLRAASSGAAVFMLRYGLEREATAAQLRWHIAPEPSAPQIFDARAPGAPRLRATLEKGRHAREAISLLVDWTGHGFAVVDTTGARDAAVTAPSRALPAALGYRLSQAG